MTIIFSRCHMSPAKYECYIQYLTCLIILKNWENKGIEEIELVPHTPDMIGSIVGIY